MKVTDEAVKAALTAWVCGSAPNSTMDEDMRAALTAALPHLQPVDVAAVRRQAFDDLISVSIDAYNAIQHYAEINDTTTSVSTRLNEVIDSALSSKPIDVAAVQEAISSVNIHDEANGYEWRGDGGDYTPKSHEKAMLEDFGHSLISQIEDAIRALSAEPAQEEGR